MRKLSLRTIGVRLGLLVFGCLFIAFAACAGVIYTLHVTDRTVDRAPRRPSAASTS